MKNNFISDFHAKIGKLSSDKLLDLIFDTIDDLLILGEHSHVDNILRTVDVKKTPINLLVGFLIITAPFRDRLNSRQDFFIKVLFKVYMNRPNDVHKILHGLQ